MRVVLSGRLAEQLDRTLPNGFLNMEIMRSHLGVGVAYDALDGLNIHARRLHRRYGSFCLTSLFDRVYNQIVMFLAILSIASNNFFKKKFGFWSVFH